MAQSRDLTSLLGLGHHLLILLSVFLGLLGWLGRQITVTHEHHTQRNGLAAARSLTSPLTIIMWYRPMRAGDGAAALIINRLRQLLMSHQVL